MSSSSSSRYLLVGLVAASSLAVAGGIIAYKARKQKQQPHESDSNPSPEVQRIRHIHPLPSTDSTDRAYMASTDCELDVNHPPPPSASAATNLSQTPESVLHLIRTTFPVWRQSPLIVSLNDAAFHVRPLTGGSSNSLWLITLHDATIAKAFESELNAPPSALVVRFYGASTGAFIERETESLVSDLLSANGVGGKIYFHFNPAESGGVEGRIEQFIPGRTLMHHEFSDPAIGHAVVRELARLHTTSVPETPEYDIIPRQPQLFVNVWKWFKIAIHARSHLDQTESDSVDIYSLSSQNRLYASFGMPKLDPLVWPITRLDTLDFMREDSLPPEIRSSRWYREARWLQELLENWTDPRPRDAQGRIISHPKKPIVKYLKDCVAYSRIGLSHNDLNPGNILYVEPKPTPVDSTASASSACSTSPGSFTLIDFEYAAFNHPQYDLANYFCEYHFDYTFKSWPFFVSKHSQYFLSQESMLGVLQAYMEEKKLAVPELPPITPSTLSHLYTSTLITTLASNLLWSLWAIIQSSTAPHSTDSHPSWSAQPDGSPFKPPALGYLEYAEQRMELYLQIKRIWLKYQSGAASTHSSTSTTDEFIPPPNWQHQMTDDEKWTKWNEGLVGMHEEIKLIQLESARRQQDSLKQYQQKVASAATDSSTSSSS